MTTPYGKVYERLYSGSMVGKGLAVFALMPYVIAHQFPSSRDPESPMMVELNAVLLAGIFGAKEEEVERAIEFLCSPDKKSRTKSEEGRRLVKEGEYLYRVVNGRYYRKLSDEEKRAEQQRKASARYRARKMLREKGVPLPGEIEYLAAINRDAPDWELEAIERRWAPKVKVDESSQSVGGGGEPEAGR